MGAKVRKLDGAWWVVIHHKSKRRKHRYGPLQRDKARAEKDAARLDAEITAGVFRWQRADEGARALACDSELDRFLDRYRPTWGPSTYQGYRSLVATHLKPYFGRKDLRAFGEADALGFLAAKRAEGREASTIRNALAVLRQMCTKLVKAGELDRNPLAGVGELVSKVARQGDPDAHEVRAWSRDEVEGVLLLAQRHEPLLADLLPFLFGCGCRLGEALALRWPDVRLDDGTVRIVRAARNGRVGPTKGRRSRTVKLPPGLVDRLRERLTAPHLAIAAGRWSVAA